VSSPRALGGLAANPAAPARTGPSPVDYTLLLVLSLIWGSTYMFIEVALRSVPPLTVAATRVVVSMIMLGGTGLLLGHRLPRDRRSWATFVTLGLIGTALPFSLMTYGQTQIDSSMAAILMTTSPLFTLGLAHLFTDDRASPRKLAGVLIGLCGMLLLLGPAALEGQTGTVVGQLLYIGVALCYAIQHVLIRRLKPGTGSHMMRAGCTLFCGALWLLPVTLVLDRPWTIDPSPDSLLALLAVGVLSTGVAHYLLFRLNASAGPNFVSANNYIAPPIGIFWGVVLLAEPVTWLRLAGLVVIFTGIALAVTRTGVARR
jgi:drug/metabolite transporter (DMT)-like permease